MKVNMSKCKRKNRQCYYMSYSLLEYTLEKNRFRLSLVSFKAGASNPNAIIIRTICSSWITNLKISQGSFAFAPGELESTAPAGFSGSHRFHIY